MFKVRMPVLTVCAFVFVFQKDRLLTKKNYRETERFKVLCPGN